MSRYTKHLIPLKRFCACGNEGIRLASGKYLRQDGALICERCRKVQSEMYHGWFRDSEILKRRQIQNSLLTEDAVMV